MKKVLITAICLMSLAPVAAFARPAYFKKFKAAYPAAEQLAAISCQICHENEETYARNPYGMDVEKTVAAGALDFAAIEALDSDGDGYTNIEEITADKAPGNKEEHPDHH